MKEEEVKKRHPIRRFFVILLIIIGMILLWARFVSTKGLVIKEYATYSASLPSHFDGFKIIHFSDLHYETTVNHKDLVHIVNTINDNKPDIVVFTGDLFPEGISLPEDSLNTLKEELQKIEPRLHKYAISGNHDYESNVHFKDFMESAGFIVLNNSYDLIFDGGSEPILLSGLPSSVKDTHNYKEAFAPLSFTEEDPSYAGNINYKILLLHEPDNIDNVSEYNVNLALAGHSHGGQVRLPFVPSIAKVYGAQKYPEEYYKVGNTELYVSSGIGTSGLKFRFFNKPSINLYRLYQEKN